MGEKMRKWVKDGLGLLNGDLGKSSSGRGAWKKRMGNDILL